MQLEAAYRVTVFVPREALRRVIDGVKRVHPLGGGDYDSVLWFAENFTEEFQPLPGAHPARGRIGELFSGPISVLVFSLPRDRVLLERVMEEGIAPHHPWEAPGLYVDETWIPR